MHDPTPPLSGLSSVGGKSVVARFDGGMLSSNSGVLALAEVEKWLRVAERLARCIDDPRCPGQVVYMIGLRMKMIAAGYVDGNDANRLRSDPIFKMAQDAPHSGRDLASQSTMCRLENLPGVRELVAMGRAMVVPPSGRFRSGSCSTSTTPSMPCTAASSSSVQCPSRRVRLPADRGVRWRWPLRRGQAAEWGTNPPPPAPPGAGDPEQLAEHPDPDPDRPPLLQSTGHRLVPRR